MVQNEVSALIMPFCVWHFLFCILEKTNAYVSQIDSSYSNSFFLTAFATQQQQQYICIHQCLLSVLEGKDMLMDSPRSEIHDNQGYDGECLRSLLTHSS